jgi:hypothetical protein
MINLFIISNNNTQESLIKNSKSTYLKILYHFNII